MKQAGGVWLPEHEEHLIEWMQKKNQWVEGKLTYQWDKLQLAMRHVGRFRTAIDVGAHCGLWSMHLARRFAAVSAFEPVAEHRACFERNVTAPNVTLHTCALGERPGCVAIHTTRGSSGDSWVSGEGEIELRRLDDFCITHVDFIKLDCEGYELFALRGAEQTILRWRPTICVEQKPGRAQKFGLPETGAVQYLQDLGAVLKASQSGDYILAWD